MSQSYGEVFWNSDSEHCFISKNWKASRNFKEILEVLLLVKVERPEKCILYQHDPNMRIYLNSVVLEILLLSLRGCTLLMFNYTLHQISHNYLSNIREFFISFIYNSFIYTIYSDFIFPYPLFFQCLPIFLPIPIYLLIFCYKTTRHLRNISKVK